LSTTLVDGDGFRVTERVVSISFDLVEGEHELIEVDFPESSFLHGAGGAGGAGGGSEGGAPASGGSDAEVDAAGSGGVAASGGGGD
jgi:hypothetical protein